MKWFKHDTDASRDTKLKKLVIKYGLEGYGLYWYCLEMIAGNVSENNITFELEDDAEIIGKKTGTTAKRVQEIMDCLVSLGLLENNDGVIACPKMGSKADPSIYRLRSDEWSVARRLIFERDNHICQYCGASGVKLECDHMIPVSRGGGNELENLITACRSCNRSKYNKTPEEWLQ